MAGNQRKKNRWRPIDEQRRKERRAAQRNEFRRLRETLSDMPHETMKAITTATALQLSEEADNRTAEPASVCLDTQEDLLTATVVALRLAEKEIKSLEDQLNRRTNPKSAAASSLKQSVPLSVVKKETKPKGRGKGKVAKSAAKTEPVSPISDIIQSAAPLQQRLLQLKRDQPIPPASSPTTEYDCMFYESESGRAILSSDFKLVDVNDKWVEQLQLVDGPSQWPAGSLRASVLGSQFSLHTIFPAHIAAIISHQFQQSLHSPSNCPSEFSFFSVRKSTLHASAPVYGDLVTVYCWTVPVASPAAGVSLSPSGSTRVGKRDSSSKASSQPLFYYDCVAFSQPNLCCTNRQILTVLHGDDVPSLARFQSLDFVNVIAETNCPSVREIFDAPEFPAAAHPQPVPTVLPPSAIGGPDTNFLRILASAAVPSPHGDQGHSLASAYPPTASNEDAMTHRAASPSVPDLEISSGTVPAVVLVKAEGPAPLSCDVSTSNSVHNLPTSLSCSSLSSSLTAFSAGPYSSVPSSPASCSTVSRSHNNSPDIRTMSIADRDTHSVLSEFSDPYHSHSASRHGSTLPHMLPVKSERPHPSTLQRPVPSAYPRQFAMPTAAYDYPPMYNMASYTAHSRLPAPPMHQKMSGYYPHDYVVSDMTHIPGAVPTSVNGFTVHTATSYSGAPWSHSVTSAYSYPIAPPSQPMPQGTDDKLPPLYSGPVPAIVTEYGDDRSDPLPLGGLPPFGTHSEADTNDRRWYSWHDAL